MTHLGTDSSDNLVSYADIQVVSRVTCNLPISDCKYQHCEITREAIRTTLPFPFFTWVTVFAIIVLIAMQYLARLLHTEIYPVPLVLNFLDKWP